MLNNGSVTTLPAQIRIDNSLGGQDKCKGFWEMLHQSDIDFKIKDFMWRKVNKGLVTRTTLYNWKMSNEKSCYLCDVCDETLLHVFTECRNTVEFVKYVINAIDAEVVLNDLFILNVQYDSLSKCKFYILCIMQYIIWRSRNLASVKNVPVSFHSLKLDFRTHVNTHLNVLFSCYKRKGKASMFRKIYMSNNCPSDKTMVPDTQE